MTDFDEKYLADYSEYLKKSSLKDLAVEAVRVNGCYPLGKMSFDALMERIDALDRDITILGRLIIAEYLTK